MNKLNFIWSALDYEWDQNFALLERFFQVHKHSNVPKKLEVNGKKLGQWVGVQRRAWRKGKLRVDRKNRLDSLEFDWTPKG